MKTLTKTIISLLLIAAMAATFCACGTAVSISVRDGAQTTKVETKTGKKIAAVLEEAKITIGEKDETEPALDARLTKDVSEIVIKRYAKVTVVKGKEKKEVELVGGTVEQAIQKAGFKLDKDESPDVDAADFLKDGMTITIEKALTVTLVHDGKTDKVTTKAKTVEKLLEEQKITLGKDDEISAKKDAKLKDGAKIVIKRVEYKTEKRTEKVPYATTKENTDSLSAGQTQVKQAGQDGEKEVTYKVKYADGKKESEKALSEKVTKEAVNEIILVGTASEDSGDGGKTIVSKTPTYNCDDQSHGYYTIVYSDGSVEYEEF
ncbi:MAG: DUF348 domain-containing protein [Ruminococcaceae bacterium]|nr:DUF348 domain-containing protein [Oscillospiraceae bacterium]